jgi:hypothetical protein
MPCKRSGKERSRLVGAVMRKLDQRGTAAWEFILVFVPLFTLIFVIFDLGRYAITAQSLRALANAEARAAMIVCYGPAKIQGLTPSCSGDYMSATQKRNAAPFLYFGDLSPTAGVTTSGSAMTVTASQPGFAMIMPIWGTALNKPSVSTSVPI